MQLCLNIREKKTHTGEMMLVVLYVNKGRKLLSTSCDHSHLLEMTMSLYGYTTIVRK